MTSANSSGTCSGAVHATAIRSAGGDLAGVVASTAERSAQVAKAWDVPARYPDFEAVLADDGVVVAHIRTPDTLHVPQAEAALREGKHVICEKPPATASADAWARSARIVETVLRSAASLAWTDIDDTVSTRTAISQETLV